MVGGCTDGGFNYRHSKHKIDLYGAVPYWKLLEWTGGEDNQHLAKSTGTNGQQCDHLPGGGSANADGEFTSGYYHRVVHQCYGR